MDEAPSTLAPSLPLSQSLLTSPPSLYLTLSISPVQVFVHLSPSPHHVYSFTFLLSVLRLHVFHFLSVSHSLYFSTPTPPPHLPCTCLVSLVPFKARQMERQALSLSSSPNDLFLTMGPNGPQIINDEGSMERWAVEREDGERASISDSLSFSLVYWCFSFTY